MGKSFKAGLAILADGGVDLELAMEGNFAAFLARRCKQAETRINRNLRSSDNLPLCPLETARREKQPSVD